MIAVLHGILALVLVVGCVLGAYEYRSYTAEQRARAPLLSTLFLAVVVLMGATGVGGLVWIGSGGTGWAFGWALIAVSPLSCLVQNRLHRKMGIDRSPFVERVSGTVAREFNVPEH